MIKNIFLKHQYRTFVKYNTIKTYKYNNNNNHAVISTIICKTFSNTKNNINAKKKKNNIKYEANKQKRKDQTILIERLKQKCPASLNLLGEMAILETVQPSRYNHNTFIDGLNNARYFFEQVELVKDDDGNNNNNNNNKSNVKDQEMEESDRKLYDEIIAEKVGRYVDKDVTALETIIPEQANDDNDDVDMGGDIDKDENVVNLETRHYRNSRYMLGALDFVQAISMVSDNVNKLPKLNVNQKLIDRSYSYFTEAAELGQADALFLLSYFHHKGFQPLNIEPNTEKSVEYLVEAIQKEHAGAILYAAQRYRFGDSDLVEFDKDGALEHFQYLLKNGWEDGWAMFFIGDDFGSVYNQKSSLRRRPKRREDRNKVYPNSALKWYLRCLKIQETEILGDTEADALIRDDNQGSKLEDDTDLENSKNIADLDNELVEKARLYLFDENEFRYKDDDLVTNTNRKRVSLGASVHEPSPPLLYGCGRRLLNQLVAGDTLGKAKSLLRAGIHYYNGFGVDKDADKALDLWQRAITLDPWNATIMEAIRNSDADKEVRSNMIIRMSQLAKDSWEMPFPQHWYFEALNTPTIINNDFEFDFFLESTQINHGDEEKLPEKVESENKPKIGFILVTTGWASMAWIEEHGITNRLGAYQLRRRFERYANHKKSNKKEHECLYAAVDLKAYPNFLEKYGYTIDQCPTIICVYNGEIHSEYGGLPDIKFDHLVKHMKRWAPRFSDLNDLVRRI